jgi:hypothetical protein
MGADGNLYRTYFFITLMIMGGNGHFQNKGPRGPVTDNRKPNSSGTDYTVARENDLLRTLYDKLGIPEQSRLYIPVNCTRFTKTAWEQVSTATAAGSELLTQPPPELNDRAITVTELRSDSMESVIQNVLPRGQGTEALALNSCDPKKDGVRMLASKLRVNQANVIVICTNVGDEDPKDVELTKSAMVVSATFSPGSGVQHKKRSRRQFQDVTRDANTGRHRELENPESIANFLVYPHVAAAFYCGLINRLRSVPCEINQTTVAFMEWATFYLQHYAEGMMDQIVKENFSRIVQGYTTRTLGWCVWLKTISEFSRVGPETTRMRDVVKKLLLDLHADAVPIVGVPIMLTCMMSRSLHMGSLLMAMLVAQSMGVPVVSWKNLNRYYGEMASQWIRQALTLQLGAGFSTRRSRPRSPGPTWMSIA